MHSAAESNVSDYGFLTNPRLLNTAITRAKSLVAVVGDPVALLTIGPCRTLWAKYFQTASIRGIALQKLQRYMVMCFAPQLPAGVPLNPLAREFVPRENGPPAFNDWIGMEPNTDADWLICPNPWAPQAEPHRRVWRISPTRNCEWQERSFTSRWFSCDWCVLARVINTIHTFSRCYTKKRRKKKQMLCARWRGLCASSTNSKKKITHDYVMSLQCKPDINDTPYIF